MQHYVEQPVIGYRCCHIRSLQGQAYHCFIPFLQAIKVEHIFKWGRRLGDGTDFDPSCVNPFFNHHGIWIASCQPTSHPRFVLLWLPTYCPRANPIERAFGDVHDKCTRNHKRKRLRDLVQDVERHVQANGPWQYTLSQVYDAPEVTAAVEQITVEDQAKIAA